MRWLAGAEYYRERFKAPDNLGATMFILLWGIGFGSAVIMAPLAVGLIFGLIGGGAAIGALRSIYQGIRPQRRGIRLDERGVTELYWLRDPVKHPWDSIRDVRIGDREASIVTDDGDVRISGARQPAWLRLARRVETLLTGATEPAPTGTSDLAPVELAEWLGIDVNGELRCRPAVNNLGTVLLFLAWLSVTLLLSAFYLPFILGIISSGGRLQLGMIVFIGAHASIFFGVFSGGLLMKLVERIRGVAAGGIRADVTGIWLGGAAGWHHHAWDELQRITMTNGIWRVTTREDEFSIDPKLPNAAKLVNAIQRALKARDIGLRLPSGGPIPMTAISRVDDASEQMGAERGLSLTGAEESESVDAG